MTEQAKFWIIMGAGIIVASLYVVFGRGFLV